MTLNLIFMSITLQKKKWTESEIMQQQNIQMQMDENQLKLQKLGYINQTL
ncbi:YrzI family small protein [Bacillus sp. B1-b2]|nr:YrzI family small protein [Bacillus sp. B1-b2]KAB7667259.1 YrzI family small protein [Bacillus sp. B1-b2]